MKSDHYSTENTSSSAKIKKKITEKWSQNSEKTVVISFLGYKE